MNTTPVGPGPLEQITFEIFTNFKAGIPAKNVVIVAVDPRMAPLSPTGTALRAARRVGLRGVPHRVRR